MTIWWTLSITPKILLAHTKILKGWVVLTFMQYLGIHVGNPHAKIIENVPVLSCLWYVSDHALEGSIINYLAGWRLDPKPIAREASVTTSTPCLHFL